MQDRLGPDPDWCTGLDGASTTKCDIKANVSGNEGAFTSLWWVLAGYKANETGPTQDLQVLVQFRETALGHSDGEACLKVSLRMCVN